MDKVSGDLSSLSLDDRFEQRRRENLLWIQRKLAKLNRDKPKKILNKWEKEAKYIVKKLADKEVDPHTRDRKIWAQYLQEIEESEGFDITVFPGRCSYYPSFAPICLQQISAYYAEKLSWLAMTAIQKYNEQVRDGDGDGAIYKFVKLVSAVCSDGNCRRYYLTFEAEEEGKPGPASVSKLFQAIVMYSLVSPGDFPGIVDLVRPKP